MDELKSCPFCGSDDVMFSDETDCVECNGCYTCGPEGVTEASAIVLWNAAPRHAHTIIVASNDARAVLAGIAQVMREA